MLSSPSGIIVIITLLFELVSFSSETVSPTVLSIVASAISTSLSALNTSAFIAFKSSAAILTVALAKSMAITARTERYLLKFCCIFVFFISKHYTIISILKKGSDSGIASPSENRRFTNPSPRGEGQFL